MVIILNLLEDSKRREASASCMHLWMLLLSLNSGNCCICSNTIFQWWSILASTSWPVILGRDIAPCGSFNACYNKKIGILTIKKTNQVQSDYILQKKERKKEKTKNWEIQQRLMFIKKTNKIENASHIITKQN